MDKTFLNASFHKLADYLSSHGYDQPINAKTLSRPSGRDFNNIMGFLFRQIDPNYKVIARRGATAVVYFRNYKPLLLLCCLEPSYSGTKFIPFI